MWKWTSPTMAEKLFGNGTKLFIEVVSGACALYSVACGEKALVGKFANVYDAKKYAGDHHESIC